MRAGSSSRTGGTQVEGSSPSPSTYGERKLVLLLKRGCAGAEQRPPFPILERRIYEEKVFRVLSHLF